MCYSPPNPFYAQTFANTLCAGAAPAPQSFIIDTASAKPFVFEMPVSTFGAAGCAPVQTFMVNTGP